MMARVPVAISSAPTPPAQLLVHSDRPGLYEVVEGGASLLAARRSGAPSLRVRLTHHPRWQAHQRGDSTLVFVKQSETARRRASTLALGANELAPLLWRPQGPGHDEAERAARAGWGPPPPPPRVGIVSFLRRGEPKTSSPLYSDRVSWFLRGAEDADATAWATALSDITHRDITHRDIDPKTWRSLGWLNPGVPDEDPRRAPGPALAAAALAAAASVRHALALTARIAIEWRPWGAVIGSHTSLTLAEEGARRSGPHVRSVDDLPLFESLEATLRHALGLAGHLAEAEADANATMKILERADGEHAASAEGESAIARTARLSVLWDHAVARDLPLPQGSLRGAPARFGFVPSPARSLLQVFALGLVPLIAQKSGIVFGVPAPVPSTPRAVRSGRSSTR